MTRPVPTFYLGTHMPSWLATLDVPLFVSHRRLVGRTTLPVARTRWALDSGGFSELSMFGRWRTTTDSYVEAVHRYAERIGLLEWVAPMDWMCEPVMLARTGLSIREHQARTIDNFQELRARLGPIVIPVLQGWRIGDYYRHVEAYQAAGVDLLGERLVGMGSVCRRQATEPIGELVSLLSGSGIELHGFGVKLDGLRRYGSMLASADSMAWSFSGRQQRPCPHSHTRANCGNCLVHALAWREKALPTLDGWSCREGFPLHAQRITETRRPP